MAEDKDIDLKNLSSEEINKLFNDIVDMPDEYKMIAAISRNPSKVADDGYGGSGRFC